MISKPENSVIEYDRTGRFATLFCQQPEREIRVFYRTNEMMEPQLQYATDPAYPDEVASTLSFTPSFNAESIGRRLSARLQILVDEEPEQTTLFNPEHLHFIFVLDRSGSMWGDRMVKAKEALILFLRSLPEGCKFTVINYGSTQNYLLVKKEISVIEYNEENVIDAIRQI